MNSTISTASVTTGVAGHIGRQYPILFASAPVEDETVLRSVKRAGLVACHGRGPASAALVSVRLERAIELAIESGLISSSDPASVLIAGILGPTVYNLVKTRAGRTEDYRACRMIEQILKGHARVLVPAGEGGRDLWIQGVIPVSRNVVVLDSGPVDRVDCTASYLYYPKLAEDFPSFAAVTVEELEEMFHVKHR